MSNTENDKFQKYAESLYNKLLELDPQKGTYLGLHEYDGRIAEVSEARIKEETRAYQELLRELSEIDRNSLTALNKFDFDLAEWALKSALFSIQELQHYKLNPMTYAFMFGQLHSYVSRDYAPFEERVKSIIAIISLIPEALEEGMKMLDKKLPAVLCDFAISFSKGYEDFFKGELLKHIEENIKSKEVLGEYNSASDKAVSAFNKFIAFLENASDQECKSYILGEEKFLRMLSISEQVNFTVPELKQLGLQ
jgi:uncharacterized protein (DUF885 family)